MLPDGTEGCDDTEEIRAMILLSFPCPPLPIQCTKELGGGTGTTDGDYYRMNGHDLLAHMIRVRTAQSDDDHNKRREGAQKMCQLELIARFDDWVEKNRGAGIPPDDVIYDFFSSFFRSYIHTYVVNGEMGSGESDVRVYPLDSVCGDSDPILASSRSFTKAQDILFAPVPSALYPRKRNVDNMTYREILRLCAARIIFS